MGNLFNKQKERRMLIQGLDAAGKTTLLYKLKLGEVVTTIPTIGFNVETVSYKNISMVMWDVGGRDKMRPLYRHYYPNTQALLFVVDSSDKDRLSDVKYEIQTIIKEEELKSIPVLVLANKQDLARALTPAYITEALELHKIKQSCNIFGISAITGEGVYEALDWLANELDGCNANQDQTRIKNTESSHAYAWKAWTAVRRWFGS